MFELIAVLGALAWLPQIYVLLSSHFIKPEVKIITESNIDIGYTTYGPIINTSLALVSEKKKALIEKIEIEITHENNDTQKFTWKWFEETLHVVDLPNSGGSIPTRKNQTAIAINIAKDELIERKIGFQQNSFQSFQKIKDQLCIEEVLNIEKAGKPRTDLTATRSYNDLRDVYQNGFNWKVGEYLISFKVFEQTVESPFMYSSKFKLTSLDLKRLKPNIESCFMVIDRNYIDSSIEYPVWNWSSIQLDTGRERS